MRRASLVVLALFSVFPACKKKPPPDRTYSFEFDSLKAPEGAKLMLDNHVIGTVTHPASWDTSSKKAKVSGKLPKDTVLAGSESKLRLVLPTACKGEMTIPVKVTDSRFDAAYEKKAYTYVVGPNLEVTMDESELPKKTNVWIDRAGSTADVSIGLQDIPKGSEHVVVHGLDCAPEVKMGGTTIGTIDDSSKAFFVTLDESKCYLVGSVTYSATPSAFGGDVSRRLKGKQVYPIAYENIGHFLKRAPGTSSGGFHVTSELYAVDCNGKK